MRKWICLLLMFLILAGCGAPAEKALDNIHPSVSAADGTQSATTDVPAELPDEKSSWHELLDHQPDFEMTNGDVGLILDENDTLYLYITELEETESPHWLMSITIFVEADVLTSISFRWGFEDEDRFSYTIDTPSALQKDAPYLGIQDLAYTGDEMSEEERLAFLESLSVTFVPVMEELFAQIQQEKGITPENLGFTMWNVAFTE